MNSIYFTTNQFTRKPSGRSRFHPGYFCIHMTTTVHKDTNRRRAKYTTPFEDFMYPIFCHMPAGMKFILASVAVID